MKKIVSLVAAFAVVLGTMFVTGDMGVSAAMIYEPPELPPADFIEISAAGTSVTMATTYRGDQFRYEVERNGVVVAPGEYGVTSTIPVNADAVVFSDSSATVDEPVLVRMRLVGRNESDWTDPVVLPFDVGVSNPARINYHTVVRATGEALVYCQSLPSSVFTGYYFLLDGQHFALATGYKSLSPRLTSPGLVYVAYCSSAGYGPLFAPRPLVDLTESLRFDYASKALTCDFPSDLVTFPDVTRVKFLLFFNPGDNRVPLFGESLSYALPADIVAGNTVHMDFALLTGEGFTERTMFACTTSRLTITQNMIDGVDPDSPDPGNPDTPGADEPGGNLFDKINALPEPWPVLIYIAGGCLIVLALGALFGRR